MKFQSMSKDSKQKLFETMEKLNPDFKHELNEIQTPITGVQNQQQKQPSQPGDVLTYGKTSKGQTSTQKTAQTRINTALEFPEAFRIWFTSLGYKPENPAISIMKVKSEIERVMRSMGYK
jgi:hypothetical protein